MAAVKWHAKNLGRGNVVGAITERSLQGIRREGKECGRAQVDGLTRSDMERVCSYAEASKTLVKSTLVSKPVHVIVALRRYSLMRGTAAEAVSTHGEGDAFSGR